MVYANGLIVTRCRAGVRERILAQSVGGRAWNYKRVMLRNGSRRKHAYVHRVVCESFHGPPPFEGAVVCHSNDNGFDNRAANLRWGTDAENREERRRNSGQ